MKISLLCTITIHDFFKLKLNNYIESIQIIILSISSKFTIKSLHQCLEKRLKNHISVTSLTLLDSTSTFNVKFLL